MSQRFTPRIPAGLPPQPSAHASALGSSWPREPCLGGGLPSLRTSSMAPGSQRTCQVQHGLQPTVLSWDRSSWGWRAEYRCREEERARERERGRPREREGRKEVKEERKERGTWREACGRPYSTTWETNGLHTRKSSKNLSKHTHWHQNMQAKKKSWGKSRQRSAASTKINTCWLVQPVLCYQLLFVILSLLQRGNWTKTPVGRV